MAKKKEAALPSTTQWVKYAGPYPQVTLKNVPEIGEITLDRGEPVELPAAIAEGLIKAGKVKASKAGTAAPQTSEPEEDDAPAETRPIEEESSTP